MSIYLDNAATTPLKNEVKAAVNQALEVYGNPSSVYQTGQAARFMVDEARRQVAALVNVRPEQVVFTASGTEAANMALRGVMATQPEAQLLTSLNEHDCVLNTAKALQQNHKVCFVGVNSDGQIDLAEIESELKKGDVALVSLMLVNNETGVIHPIAQVAELCHRYGALCHTDAVQAPGHLPLNFESLGVDMLSISAHKFGGPKGVGALIVAGKPNMAALITGGAQERNRRAGTENTLGIAGMGVAAEVALREQDKAYKHCRTLQQQLEKGLKALANDIRIVAENVERAPHITQFITPGLNAEDAIIALDLKGVCVSQGSACSSGRQEPSHVLLAQGFNKSEASSGLRISTAYYNTKTEIDAFLQAFGEVRASLV